jgi:hypothetical protein
MTDDRTHHEQPPGGVAGPPDDAPTQRSWAIPTGEPGTSGRPDHRSDDTADTDPDGWSDAGSDSGSDGAAFVTGYDSPERPPSWTGADAGAAWYSAPAPETIVSPAVDPPLSTASSGLTPPQVAPSGLGAVGFAAVSSLRRHRRQTITFAAVLALVLVLGAGAFAVFKGTIAWPFGGGPTPAAACVTPTPTVQASGVTRVRVYNATNRRGFALSVARDLQKRGFKVPTVGNDPQESKPTAAVIRHGPNGVLAAHTLATQLAGKVVYQQDDRIGDMVDLVLGPGFAMVDAKKGAAALKAVPTPAPGCLAAV